MEKLAVKGDSVLGSIEITGEQVELVKTTVFPGATDDELKLYFFECRRRGVHPLDRLVIPVKRKNRVAFQTSIDLFRSQAEETGEYRGQEDVEYGNMMEWQGIDKKVPEWAKVTIFRFDPMTNAVIKISAIAFWNEYYPGDELGFQWKKMPRLMLGKCAEALALRKAFPRKLAGLYTFEEMQLTDLINQGKKPMKEPAEKEKLTIKDPDSPATEPQMKAIYSLLDKLKVKEEDRHSYIAELFPIKLELKSLKDLTKGQASYSIDKLNNIELPKESGGEKEKGKLV